MSPKRRQRQHRLPPPARSRPRPTTKLNNSTNFSVTCQAKASARGARNSAPALSRFKARAIPENQNHRRLFSAPTLRRKQRQRWPPPRLLRSRPRLDHFLSRVRRDRRPRRPRCQRRLCQRRQSDATTAQQHNLHFEFASQASAAPQLTLTRRLVVLRGKQRPLPRYPSTTTSATFSDPRCRGVVGCFATWAEHLLSKGDSNVGDASQRTYKRQKINIFY